MSLQSEETVLKVIDSSLTLDHPKRIHQIIINGEVTDVIFVYGEDKFLPESVAMKFSKEGFRIVHPDDTEVEIPREIPHGAPVQLLPDEVIARYTELTFEALRTRAVILPGGEKFIQDGVQSQDIIDFLMGKEPTIDGEEELGEMDDEEGDDLADNKPHQNATDTQSDAKDPDASTDSTGTAETNTDADAKDPQGEVNADAAANADASKITEYKEGE